MTQAADWRSGQRWSATSMLYLVHPFASSRHFPSRGNEKIGGTGYCVTYDTDSQSRNVLASPLGEEGHEVAKGCTRVRMIMILDVDVTAEGGIIKLIAREGNPPPFEPSRRRRVQWRQPPPPPSGQRPVKLKNPKNPFPLWYCVPPSPRKRWDNHRGTKSRQPSHRRCVHNKKYL